MTLALVVEDSPFMRRVVARALADAGYAVETATDGREAVEAVERHEPDVVTMDVEMPVMDGIEAIDRIMSSRPTPIVVLSAHTDEGAETTVRAIEKGATTVLHKPDGSDGRTVLDLAEEVVETVDGLADAEVSTAALARAAAAIEAVTEGRPRTAAAGAGATACPRSEAPAARSGETTTQSGGVVPTARSGETTTQSGGVVSTARSANVAATGRPDDCRFVDDPTIVVGASTGGPKIVEALVAGLPVELGARVLVVQHMPEAFTGRFAARLDEIGDYHVREAGHGDRVGPGEVLVAPGDAHLVVDGRDGDRPRVRTEASERIHGVRPAIDVTMETAAETVSGSLAGVVLTGMGRDGAAGIEAIHEAGGRTIAQDEATSPVFGIPRRAIETGCVERVVPADGLVGALLEAFETDGECYE